MAEILSSSCIATTTEINIWIGSDIILDQSILFTALSFIYWLVWRFNSKAIPANQCWYDNDTVPASQTLVQHQPNIGWALRVSCAS